MIRSLIRLAEKGVLPDFLIRFGIRKLSKVRLDKAKYSTKEEVAKRHQDWVSFLKKSSIAYVPEKANEQHYEVPPLFFKYCLGPNLKYSSGYWPNHVNTLEESELAMLELSCERAKIEDDTTILDLDCGWVSFT